MTAAQHTGQAGAPQLADTPLPGHRCRAGAARWPWGRPVTRPRPWPNNWRTAWASASRQRLLAPGARLPSVRDCARRHGVSPSTVVGAYDLLQARGLVQAQPQRGFFVRDPGLRQAPRPASAAGCQRPWRGPRAHARAPVDATALIRSMFKVQGGLHSPGMGTLPETWLDADVLQRALRRVCQDGPRPG